MSASMYKQLGELSASLVEAAYVDGVTPATLANALRTLHGLYRVADPTDGPFMAELRTTLEFVRSLRARGFRPTSS